MCCIGYCLICFHKEKSKCLDFISFVLTELQTHTRMIEKKFTVKIYNFQNWTGDRKDDA